MMEINRQQYLASIGIDSYSPRFLLPDAPIPFLCDTGLYFDEAELVVSDSSDVHPAGIVQHSISTNVDELLQSLNPVKILPSVATPAPSAKILPVEATLSPFSFSYWRVTSNHLIINERSHADLLPTEHLLHNILKIYHDKFVLAEELLRCPAVTSRRKVITAVEAQLELKTWLSAEHEQQPITHLWLMGDKTHRFFIDSAPEPALFSFREMSDIGVNAILLPSLQALLSSPSAKANLLNLLNTAKHE